MVAEVLPPHTATVVPALASVDVGHLASSIIIQGLPSRPSSSVPLGGRPACRMLTVSTLR